MRDLPTGVVTLLFSDVEGSTRLLHELGATTYGAALAEHRVRFRAAVAARGGVEVDTQGDAFFVAFPDADAALAAASDIQGALADGPIRVRIGIHTGSPQVAAEGYVGTDVHRAARIAAAGHGGQVLFSRETGDALLAVGRAEGPALIDLGEHRLKDFVEPVWLFQLGTASFPPLRTISNTNLPRPASSFVGRERQVAELVAMLRDGSRLVTLTGPGGTGKTRLAIESATELVPSFRNGVFWVGLAAVREAALVDPAIGEAIGAHDDLAGHIAQREMLLLIDNVEQVIDAGREVAALVEACPNLRVLATSREPLRVRGEAEYPVPPLEREHATRLFAERSGREADEIVAELCRRLDDLPLAVELAAARARLLSPRQILERLGQRLDLLRGGRDADARQQTLRATIAWSYDLLTDAEQALFARLSVFSGGWTVEAAEAITAADLEGLQSLVEKSLIRQRDGRLSMLETIREYAAERFIGIPDAQAVRADHARFFAEFVEAAEPHLTASEQVEWWARLTAEEGNIRAALAWATGGGDTTVALRLSAAMWRYWWQRGQYAEGRRWSEASLAQAPDAPESLRIPALYSLASMALGTGDDDEALRLLPPCLAWYREVGDSTHAIWALTDMGIAHTHAGRVEASRAASREALALAREGGHRRYQGVLGINLANSYLATGEWQAAEESLTDAMALVEASGDEGTVANILENLAIAMLRTGRGAEAAQALLKSIRLSRRTDDRLTLLHSLMTASAILLERGDPASSARALAAATRLREEGDVRLDSAEERLALETAEGLRSRLPEADLEAVTQAGRAWDYEQALDETVAALG